LRSLLRPGLETISHEADWGYWRSNWRQQKIAKSEELISNKPIVIVGAGIGGLVAALALQQRGFEVALYEQARDLREVGTGVQISPTVPAYCTVSV
jgi:NADPH-dependent 2,4-dienoyl-CoA reductase/sulfur reductase-like enzyme